MIQEKFNEDWKYWIDEDSFALVWNIPETAKAVTLPHDAMIEADANPESPSSGNTGFRDGAVYNYVKIMQIPKEYENKTVMLKFEGIYMNAFIYVNGQLAGKNPFGYTTFYVLLNCFLKYGERNEVRIQARNGAMPNSRWYSGGGIYRDVYLLVSNPVYIVPEGLQIKTEYADEEYAVIQIDAEIKNRCHIVKELRLEHRILDVSGGTVALETMPVTLFESEERKLTGRMAIAKPQLWSDESPCLYTCISKLYEADRILDESREVFGIRTLELDAKRGLRVNKKAINLRGACIHHDSGLLGAATYEEAQFRQIQKLKAAGFNAVRMAHHPMAPAMLRACDQLGIYVMDEAFDMWTRCKSNYDYGLYFQEWWKDDVTAMVRKDYNHPSVIMYSVGNEIPEIGTPHGAKICQELCAKIKELDDGRYTLASTNGVFASGDAIDEIVRDVASGLDEEEIKGNVNDFMTLMDRHLDEIVVHPAISRRLERACVSTDIAGYNYMTARYEPDGEQYPNRIIVGSETYPPEIGRNWKLVKKLPYVIGDFTWTGWDYIGEAGVGIAAYQWGEGGFGAGFPCQLAYVGDFDITGFRRPLSYYREIVFGLRNKPYIAVQKPERYGQHLIKTPWMLSDTISSWNHRGCEGNPVIVEIYADGAEVELLRNDTSLGRKAVGSAGNCRVLFETTYEPGVLKAVSYDDKGQKISESEIRTAKTERKLEACLEERPEIAASQLFYIPINVSDGTGVTVTDEVFKIRAKVTKGAEIAGFGSGNPKTKYNYNVTETETYQGKALLIVKKTLPEIGIQVDVIAEGIEKVTIEIPAGM